MTKKHYQALARALYDVRPMGHPDTDNESAALGAWRDCVEAVGVVCRTENHHFDVELFEEACETGECKGLPALAEVR